MTEERTISWIYLAIGMALKESHVTFTDISMMADGINHAVPTHQELQVSVSWLIKHGLVEKKGNKYLFTDAGKINYTNAVKNLQYLLPMWDALELEIRKLKLLYSASA